MVRKLSPSEIERIATQEAAHEERWRWQQIVIDLIARDTLPEKVLELVTEEHSHVLTLEELHDVQTTFHHIILKRRKEYLEAAKVEGISPYMRVKKLLARKLEAADKDAIELERITAAYAKGDIDETEFKRRKSVLTTMSTDTLIRVSHVLYPNKPKNIIKKQLEAGKVEGTDDSESNDDSEPTLSDEDMAELQKAIANGDAIALIKRKQPTKNAPQ